MADKPSVQVRALADRFRARATDPRFGGRNDPDGETYALAMMHATEMALYLAQDLEAEDA